MIADLPRISELDIKPLFAGIQGVLALESRKQVQPVIRPYPQELEEEITFASRKAFLRPIRPEDEPRHQEFFGQLDPEDVYSRFFAFKRELSHSELIRFTQIDFDREMAFIATQMNEQDQVQTLGVVRSITDSVNYQAELAILVRSDLKGKGLGRTLVEKMIRYCRSRGTKILTGEVLRSNTSMLALANKLDFELRPTEDIKTIAFRLKL